MSIQHGRVVQNRHDIPTNFIGQGMQRLIKGYYSIADEELLQLLELAHRTKASLLRNRWEHSAEGEPFSLLKFLV